MSRPDPAVIVTGILYVVVAMVAAAGFFKVEYSPGRFSADAMAGNTASMALLWAFCLLQLS